jgi:hypothetical protein
MHQVCVDAPQCVRVVRMFAGVSDEATDELVNAIYQPGTRRRRLWHRLGPDHFGK